MPIGQGSSQRGPVISYRDIVTIYDFENSVSFGFQSSLGVITNWYYSTIPMNIFSHVLQNYLHGSGNVLDVAIRAYKVYLVERSTESAINHVASDSEALLLPYALSGFDPQVKCAELKLYSAYSPVNVVCWKRAICLEFIGKVPQLLQFFKPAASCLIYSARLEWEIQETVLPCEGAVAGYIKIWCYRFDLEQLNQAIQMSLFCCLIVRLLQALNDRVRTRDIDASMRWAASPGPP
ncbi:unnamed protein product [Miscanthus lutarioriparius]|uniref:Uncharacterized protein n=1 Tax=Miscanthus lutarioriparius TaxID=422564 RepID=A0A811RE99_9POAL|nr:unnamed protein product [Miscanthus lutarioriparius]